MKEERRILYLLTILWIVAGRICSPEDEPFRPHVVLIVVDDVNTLDFGLHGSGIATPNLNSLAKSGKYLTNHYVHPSCTHTRAALLTGRNPYKMGLLENARGIQGIPLNEELLPQILRRAGYATHAVGKWHVGSGVWEQTPTFRGFETFLGYYGNTGDHYKHCKYMSKSDRGQKIPYQYDLHWHKHEKCSDGCDEPFDARGKYSTVVLSQRTQNIIRNHATTKPLFTYLAFPAAHDPFQAPTWAKKLYREKPWNTNRKAYAAMITVIDREIGRIVRALGKKNMWRDTMLVVMSDNGAPIDVASKNFPLRGKKMTLYEGAIRLNAIVSGPGMKKVGFRTGKMTRLFHVTDWLPTLASMVGVEPEGQVLDGLDQTRTLGGNLNAGVRKGFFVGYNMHRQSSGVRSITADGIREDEFKLIRIFGPEDERYRERESYELYDLKRNQGERNNVVSMYPLVRDRLLQQLNRIVSTFLPQQEKESSYCTGINQAPKRTKWGMIYVTPHCHCDALNACFNSTTEPTASPTN